jgi:hypothetical protein
MSEAEYGEFPFPGRSAFKRSSETGTRGSPFMGPIGAAELSGRRP